MLRPALPALTAGLLALSVAGTAAADARGELHAAFQKNLALKSYRAAMTDLKTGKVVSTVEFQAPDRFRISVAGGPTSVVADGFMYMTVNGRSMKMPLPAGIMESYRSNAAWKEMEKDSLIRATGAGTVGAEPARKYHWITSGKNASTGDAWVSIKSGHVLQVDTVPAPGSQAGAVRVRYTDFNTPGIRVSPPN